MRAKETILKIVNIDRNYYSRTQEGEKITYPVIRGISFEISEGEFVGIMGRSGCGKTTLLKVLGLIDKPSKGEVYFKDSDTKEIAGDYLAEVRRKEIAFVFQDYYLMEGLTVEENIMLPLILDERDAQEIRVKAEQLARQFQMTSLMKKRVNELSGGEKQRVAICRALITDPALILADEPTGNLDSSMSQNVIETLLSINQKMKKTILMVTHDPIIASYCNRVIFLKDGKIVEDVEKKTERNDFYNSIIDRMAKL